jgi:hypothetical protein
MVIPTQCLTCVNSPHKKGHVTPLLSPKCVATCNAHRLDDAHSTNSQHSCQPCIHAQLKGLCLLFHEVVAFSLQLNNGVDNDLDKCVQVDGGTNRSIKFRNLNEKYRGL